MAAGSGISLSLWNASVLWAAGLNVTTTTHKLYVHITKWEYEPLRQFKLSVLLCILCKCNCRRRTGSSHSKSATQFAPQKRVSLITEKFPKEEGGQWPTSVSHFAKVTYLRPRTRLFNSPTLRRLGLCCDRSKPPKAETWNSLAHALTEFRIGKRILVDDLRSFRRRRSKQGATLAASGVKLPVIDKMSASMVARLFNLGRDMRTRVLTNPSNNTHLPGCTTHDLGQADLVCCHKAHMWCDTILYGLYNYQLPQLSDSSINMSHCIISVQSFPPI